MMHVDRENIEHLTKSHRKDDIPIVTCPKCYSGMAIDKESITDGLSGKTKRVIGDVCFDPVIEYEGRFTAIFSCGNHRCKEQVVAIGLSYQEYYNEINGEQIIDQCYKIKNFFPPIALFQIPKRTPDKIKETITLSFGAFFSDPKGAANHLRSSLEHILDDLNIGLEQKSLQRRIERISIEREDLSHFKDQLEAAKWLGNVGSHASRKIDHPGVIAMYDLLENFISHIYQEDREERHAQLDIEAAVVNHHKGAHPDERYN